ncbi:MAG TPA: phosphoribosylformylglycinamidine synthase subunit PurS [Tepidisphaeraceae bacterium]|jgi:phosphoribosylformylglycinamidine synthase
MIYRIDVGQIALARGGEAATDPVGETVRHQIQEYGRNVGRIRTQRIFLFDTDAGEHQVKQVADELLADPIVECAQLVKAGERDGEVSRIEIHLKPGVMDPVAASTERAARDLGVDVKEVRTGRAYLIEGKIEQDELRHIASKILANDVVESIHFEAYVPTEFKRLEQPRFELRHVALRNLSDEQLTKLSRERHLFLSLTEMKAIQSYYRAQNREPTDIELETLAQTWSEHCVHKTLKSAVEVEVKDEAGKTIETRRYGNLIKETIFDSTMELMKRGMGVSPMRSGSHGRDADATEEPFCLSVFKDNAGVVRFDETDAVCFKVETHNHPSAIEPYGGSATGVGGVIRDIMGTGLAAKPIANTDVFCVALPDSKSENLPKGVIHPRRTLQQVVAGVRDYGNRMGIPTVNGAVYFDKRYVGNPLVFCGCVGLIPQNKISKDAQPGDAIVLMGGRTGRDGIHGATFSSAELTDTHADEFSHAVQIGNAITQKKMADVILAARDRDLFSAITDCGAGGLSSAVGEMGEKVGATVELDRVPLKYVGLKYDEIWISEAQERMVLSVPTEKVETLLKMAKDEDVEATVIGTFGTANRDLILNYKNQQVGRLAMQFVHEGIPMPTRKAVISSRGMGVSPMRTPMHGRDAHATQKSQVDPADFKNRLLKLLAHPNIASKHWIIRQYDHEVQGGSVIKPLVGPMQIGPSDAAVIRPKLSSFRGVALGAGLAPHVDDAYSMAIGAIDEAIRNVVCVGADPSKVAILDNFCWPSCDDEVTMGTLVRACEACRDAALAYGIPFISGKDSLHNQFTIKETGEVIKIPPTLLISAIGVLEDVRKCVTMDFKHRTARVVRVTAKNPEDLHTLAETHRRVAKLIASGKVAAAHDISEGGLAVAAAEMCIASGLGLITGDEVMFADDAFDERPGQYLLELKGESDASALAEHFGEVASVRNVGLIQHLRKLTITTPQERAMEIGIEELTAAWRGTLDW